MKRLLALLACLTPLLALGEPRVLVETRITPPEAAMVGGTARLEVDLLVDTWFTAPPQLPGLELPSATVQSPAGQAIPLTELRDGTTFFGLRFTYLITPNQARRFDVPALAIRVNPGQGGGPLTVHSQPLGFVAQPLPGVTADQQLLVARTLTFTQRIARSHDPLRVGDSITRELEITAGDAQAVRIPIPQLADIEGLKRFPTGPRLQTLDDGRGNMLGGRRQDASSYVVKRAGHYKLPAIELEWWDASAGQIRRASVDAIEFEAEPAPAYQAAFSIAEDLERLGQQTRWQISRYWLLFAAALPLGGLLIGLAPRWTRRALGALRRYREARHRTWIASEKFAWRQVPGQLAKTPLRLDAFYLWVRRSCGSTAVGGLSGKLSTDLAQQLQAFLKSRYGREPQNRETPATLRQVLPRLRRELLRKIPRRETAHGLKALNPQGGADLR